VTHGRRGRRPPDGAPAAVSVLPLPACYLLPLRSSHPQEGLTDYLRTVARLLQVIVVDGSAPEVFAVHHAWWAEFALHVPPARVELNGKVAGVLTGLDLAVHDRVVIADDDVRYTPELLQRVVGLLDEAEVVRPQNAFEPLPWHALLDTGRTLLNRWTGGDWPGTLAVRRSALPHGYAGGVLFENLEMVRTVVAGGGRERLALDCVVPRLAPTTRHYLGQRVRQAYDELARPLRLTVALSVVPGLWATRRRPRVRAAAAAALVAIAEGGRWRAGGRAAYPGAAALLAPLWVLERGVTAWLALGCRLGLGGIRYGDVVFQRAATPPRVLRRAHRPAPDAGAPAAADAAGRGRTAPLASRSGMARVGGPAM